MNVKRILPLPFASLLNEHYVYETDVGGNPTLQF
jgi:hypothetical protein